jgi:FtsX-like permease family
MCVTWVLTVARRVGDRIAIMLGDGTAPHATVVAVYTRDLAFGDALLAPELAAGHLTTPLLNEILVQAGQPAAVVAGHLRALAQRYPGLQVSDSASLVTANAASDELDHWLGPFFVAMIFAFTSIAVANTLIMIALRRRRELALLRLTGATARQVRSMARWEASLIIAIGLGIGLAITATAGAAQPRAHRRLPSLRAGRLARGDPRCLGPAGPGGPVRADAPGATHPAGRGDRDPGIAGPRVAGDARPGRCRAG